MEACQEHFQVFIDTLDPNQFLEDGNEGIESLSKFLDFKIQEINSKHISVLTNIIFLQTQETKPAFPFFAAQVLENFAQTLGDRFLDIDLITANFELLHKSASNLTSCGYFCQFLKPLLMKRNRIIEKVFQDVKVVKALLACVQSLNVCSVIKEYIEGFPESCKSLVEGLLGVVLEDEVQRATCGCEVLKRTIRGMNGRVVGNVFSEGVIVKLIRAREENKRHCLRLVSEILVLPQVNRVRNLALRVVEDHSEELLSGMKETSGETLIETFTVLKLAIISDFCSITYLLGSSQLMQLATVTNKQEKTFTALWNSQLHLAYFDLIKASMDSGSNALISSILSSGLLKVLISSAEHPFTVKGKLNVRKGFMGFVTKIGCLLRDSRIESVKTFLRTAEGWEGFLIYVNTQEAAENRILGGRPRYRHMTAEEITGYMGFGMNENVEKAEVFFERNFWRVPVEDLDEVN